MYLDLIKFINAKTPEASGEPAENGGASDETENTVEKKPQSIEFTAAQQATLQTIVDKTLAKGIERGRKQFMEDLGLSPDDLPKLKGLLTAKPDKAAESKAVAGNGDEGEWQKRFEKIQETTASETQAMREEIKKQRQIAGDKAIDAELSAELSKYQLADTVSAMEIRSLLKQKVVVDDSLNPIVQEPDGTRPLNARGDFVNVSEFISTFFSERPHYLARSRGGAGSSSVMGTTSRQIDLGDLSQLRPGDLSQRLQMEPQLLEQIKKLVMPTTDINPFALKQHQK